MHTKIYSFSDNLLVTKTDVAAFEDSWGWTVGDPGLDSWREAGILTLLLCPDKLGGPPSLLSNGYLGQLP